MAGLTGSKKEALNRLKTVRGHLDGIIRMVEQDAYCVELMKQISAVEGSLERTNRIILQNHLETCFSEAVRSGDQTAAIQELMDAVKFNTALTGRELPIRGQSDVTGYPSRESEATEDAQWGRTSYGRHSSYIEPTRAEPINGL